MLSLNQKHRKHWRTALLIRRVEERLLELFSEGRLNGTLHTCVGQEWSAVAICSALEPQDWVFSNHRGHGHFLARTGNVEGLIAEVMGRATGVCGGHGGSQHLMAIGYYSNGILGGMTPVAAGAGFAGKLAGDGSISVVFLGDGALGEGIVYETLNLTSKWSVPLLMVVERNGFAQSTDCRQTQAGTIAARVAAFDVAYLQGDIWDWETLIKRAKEAVHIVRSEQRPVVLEVGTFRLKAHSKGDDNRDKDFVQQYWNKDPLNRWLDSAADDVNRIDAEVRNEIERAVQAASQASFCQPLVAETKPEGELIWRPAEPLDERLADETHKALREWMERNGEAFMLGEDIEGAYGGAFKITRNLSFDFPGRVCNTPISESAITGFATGMALRGRRPAVEIMFGDFTTLILDQMLQHACKFRSMYGGGVDVPLVVRTPMGGRRGYGPTHSQSLEKHFLGVPNLRVLSVNHRLPVREFYAAAFSQRDPVLIIENKILYTRKASSRPPLGFSLDLSNEAFPCVRLVPEGRTPGVTLFCYGGMLEEAEAAAVILFDEDEIVVEIISPSQLQPFDVRMLAQSVTRSQRLVTCEEGSSFGALCAEAIARLLEAGVKLEIVHRLSFNGVIPSSYEAEKQVLPNASQIVSIVRSILK